MFFLNMQKIGENYTRKAKKSKKKAKKTKSGLKCPKVGKTAGLDTMVKNKT